MILGIRQAMDQEDSPGSSEDLSRIIAATEYMDGLDHTDATAAQLETAIKQIVRRGERRTQPVPSRPEIPEIEGFENSNAFAILVTQEMIDADIEGKGGFFFGLQAIKMRPDRQSYSVSWGDGTFSTGLNASISTGWTTIGSYINTQFLGKTGVSAAQTGTNGTVTNGKAEVCHLYTVPGLYVIQISDDIDWFKIGFSYYDNGEWNPLMTGGYSTLAMRFINSCHSVVHALRWGSYLRTAFHTYYRVPHLLTMPSSWGKSLQSADGCFCDDFLLTGHIPPWNSSMQSVQSCYQNCYGLTGSIPQWNNAITNMHSCYSGCSGLTGAVPPWPSHTVSLVGYCYQSCVGLTGRIPVWGKMPASAEGVYKGCTGLTGPIPSWPDSITDPRNCYQNCSGLTGPIPPWNKVGNSSNTYNGCSGLTGSIPPWNSNMYNTAGCYGRCTGLTGPIPEWGPAVTNANATYQWCIGLTGSIPAWNSKITNTQSCYDECKNLTGPIPEWGPAVTNAYGVYNRCCRITGTIPEWTSKITTANTTYQGCTRLTGVIPAWGSAITNASACYNGCANLSGVWTVEGQIPSDAELMPTKITSKGSCVSNCTPTMRAYFTTAWGGTRAN